ncbi:MAG: hypothetical protein GY778_13305, partial [bacterium]|nr:hypothetical protein [bacterium]
MRSKKQVGILSGHTLSMSTAAAAAFLVMVSATLAGTGLAWATPLEQRVDPVAWESIRGVDSLEGRLQTVLDLLANSQSGAGDAPLPDGTRLFATEWVDGVLQVDLELPSGNTSLNLSGPEIDGIVALLSRAVDTDSEFRGVRVRYRGDVSEPFRLLESLSPVFDPGDYDFVPDRPAPAPEPGDGGASAQPRGGPTVGQQPTGALTGVTVFANAGHGWTATTTSWGLQRPLLFNMIEDYGNIEQLNTFAQYCYNAGATVVPFRPVGYQHQEVVLDQDDPEVSYTGPWTSSSGSPYYENNRTVSGISYRFSTAVSSETATARYTPDLPVADYYPVYTWVLCASNRTLQKYRIAHSGGTTEVFVDHRLVGKGWVWLGHYYFEAGTGGYVEISNESNAGGVAITDAIRFGNGMGDVVGAGPGTISGYPRDEEANRYWAESETDINANGLPTSIYDCCSSDSSDNVGTAARWSREMNDTSVNNDRWRRVYLEFHSNASGGSARGSLALITGNATTNQAAYADIMGNEIEEDMQILDGLVPFEHSWGSRANTFSGAYGAISTTNNGNEFDATIIEVAFHDNQQDTELLLDPKVRDAVGRASVHAIIKFLNSLAGSTVPLAFAPVAPERVQAVHNGSGGVVVSWIAPPSGEAYGQAPTGYRVYRSTNGYGFDGGLDVGNTLTTTLNDVPADTTTFLRVTAYNAGGESMPSETMAVRRAGSGGSSFLIVSGFDRIGRSQNPYQVLSGVGTQRRPIMRHVNSRDYTVQHGLALAAAGATFDSCANEAVISGAVTLGGYPAIDWICGEESSADSTFDA